MSTAISELRRLVSYAEPDQDVIEMPVALLRRTLQVYGNTLPPDAPEGLHVYPVAEQPPVQSGPEYCASLSDIYEQLTDGMVDLPPEDEKLLRDNLWEMYDDAVPVTPSMESFRACVGNLLTATSLSDVEVLDATSGICRDAARIFRAVPVTRANLRLATRSQNQANAKRVRGKTSKFKGVFWKRSSWRADRGSWAMCVTKGDTRVRRAGFATEEEAAREYDRIAVDLYGEYASPNFDAARSSLQQDAPGPGDVK